MRLERKHHCLAAIALAATLLVTGLAGCAGETSAAMDGTAAPQSTAVGMTEAEAVDAATRPQGWSEETHGSGTEPNYGVVFPEDRVNQITVIIAPEDWEAMQANMVDLFGEAGSGGDGRGFPDGALEPPEGAPPQASANGFPEGSEPPEGWDGPALPPGPPPAGHPDRGGFGDGDMTPENPMWVPATIEFEGNTWTNVGVRYKGNSSLTSSWRSGSSKLPLKLDFDEFEDDYPQIEDQRFYGFKQLSLSNGFSDPSFLRDAAASSILQEAGLPAAETAFYEVILDYGEGPVSLGLYTLIEVVDDTVVERSYGSDGGNIYEAEGSAASFAAATYGQIEQSFQKENNQDESDWGDIESLFEVLHDDQRTSDPASWRASLESLLDVDGFLEWLAISAVIEHWDTYGSMSHNYYLYHDPDSGQLKWISWDHNMVMLEGVADRGGRGPHSRGVTLDKTDVDESWPLIRYLLDDPVYYGLYLDYLEETIAGVFEPDHVAQTYQTWAALIEPYAAAEAGEEEFASAVEELVEYAYQRADDVQEFLSSSQGESAP